MTINVQSVVEEAFAFWIRELSQAFPGIKPFSEPHQFVAQYSDHIRMKENAALQRAINVLQQDDRDRHKTAIVLVRSCMRGEE